MRIKTLWKIGARCAPMLIYVDRYKTQEIIRVGDIRQSEIVIARNAEKRDQARQWLSGR